MLTDARASELEETPHTGNPVLKRLAQVGTYVLVLAGVLFLSSGRLDWAMAWVYLGLTVALVAVTAAFLLRFNRELIAERSRVGKGTPGWDRLLGRLCAAMGIGSLLICGLDVRWGWSPRTPPVIQIAALGPFVLGSALAIWAMASNAFFATTVRIQKERGHRVVTEGPYHYVRHPGYIGWIVCNLVTPLILGSVWALIPAGLTVGALVVRTTLEDQMLHAQLDGYRRYASAVRYRLVPGVW